MATGDKLRTRLSRFSPLNAPTSLLTRSL